MVTSVKGGLKIYEADVEMVILEEFKQWVLEASTSTHCWVLVDASDDWEGMTVEDPGEELCRNRQKDDASVVAADELVTLSLPEGKDDSPGSVTGELPSHPHMGDNVGGPLDYTVLT